MPPTLTLAAAGYGAAFGLLPIGWLILNAIFIYQLSVETGQFAVLQNRSPVSPATAASRPSRSPFASAPSSRAPAGFGAPVAISGALMIGLGFKPLEAAKLALIGNTAPVAFGSLGIPITTLAPLTGLDVLSLSAMVGRQLPFFSLLVPFWLVTAQCGWRGMIAVWPCSVRLRRHLRLHAVSRQQLPRPTGWSISSAPLSPWPPWSRSCVSAPSRGIHESGRCHRHRV